MKILDSWPKLEPASVLALDLHLDRALADPAAQIVEAGPHDLALALDLDLLDIRAVHREYLLDALAVGDPSDREGLVDASALAGDHDSGKDLYSLPFTFPNPSVHTHAVANLERGHIRLDLAQGDFSNNWFHWAFVLNLDVIAGFVRDAVRVATAQCQRDSPKEEPLAPPTHETRPDACIEGSRANCL